MTEPLEIPEDLKFGYVVDQVLLAAGDGDDADDYPDVIPATGTITFVPLTPNAFVHGGAATIAKQAVRTRVGEDGRLVYNGKKGVWLVVGDYSVRYQLDGAEITNVNIVVREEHTPEHPLVLARHIELKPTPSMKLVVNEELYRQTEALVDEARGVVTDLSEHVRTVVAEYLAELGVEVPPLGDPDPDPEPGPSFDPPTSTVAPAVLPDPVEDGQRFVAGDYFSRPSSSDDLWVWKPVVTGAPQVTDVTHEGAHTVLLDRPGQDARISENATDIVRRETINASVWVKAPAGQTARFRLLIRSIGMNGNTTLGYDAPWLTVTDGDWIKVAISATVPGDADGVQVRVAQADAPVYVSDGELWMSPGTPGRSFTLDGMYHRDGETYTIPGEGNPREVVFSPDGKQFSVVERAARRVSVHHLSTPWDITTAQPWAVRDFALPSALEFGHGHAIRPDGRRMWVHNRTEVWQWDLSAPWVPATAHNVTRQTLPEITRGHDLDFRTDGTRLLIDDRVRGTVDMYTLSTPWDVTTATHTASRTVTRQAAMRGIEMTPDGSTLFQLDPTRLELWQYELDTPWDITTMRWVQTRGMTAAGTDPRSITWAADGGSFYVTDATSGVMTRLWATAPAAG